MKYRSRSLRRRRDTDKWEVALTHNDPITGKLVTTYHTVEAKTPKQAERARDELIMDLERRGGAYMTKITLREFLDRFLEHKEEMKAIESSTVRGYRAEIRLIDRYIGSEMLSDVSIPVIDSWMAQMVKDGYAPKTISKCFRLLKQAMNHAVSLELLAKNPCNFCKPPKRTKTPINSLNREERSRMLELARAAQPEPLAVAIEIALTTGMRRGEVCALRWSDLKSDGSISVSHALGNGEGGFYEKEPKTGRPRTIPLTSHTYAMLCEIRRESEQLLGKLGITGANPYILGTQEASSRPYNPTILGKEFAAFCKMNGFDCTFHDLRHTFATFMIANGVDVRTVADYLGHASVSMTLDTYADVSPEAKWSAVDKIEQAFDDSVSVEFAGRPRSDKPFNVASDAIPFTAEELETMLAIKRAQKG